MSDTFAQILAANRSTPTADPATSYAAGTTANNVGDAINYAQGATGFADTQHLAASLRQQDPTHQKKQWDSYDDATRQRLIGIGYSGPPPSPHKGFLGRLIGDVVGAPGAVIHDVNNDVVKPVVRDVVKPGMKALNVPLQQVQHLYRTVEASQAEHPSGIPGFVRSLALTNPITAGFAVPNNLSLNDWADLWHRTANGDDYVTPQAQRHVQSTWGNDVYNQAKDLILKGQPADNLPKEVQDAHSYLKDHQLSFGRSVVPQWLWDNAHPLATAISGGYDAMFDIELDPTLRLGQLNKAYKAAKYGVQTWDDVGRLVDNPGPVRNWTEDVGHYLQNKQVGALLERYPKLNEWVPSLQDQNVSSAEDLRNFMKDKANVNDVLNGRVAGPVRDKVQLPTLTTAQRLALDAKGVAKQVIDWGADRTPNLGDPSLNDTVKQALAGAVGSLRKVTTLDTEGNTINLLSPDQGATAIQRLASRYLPASTTRDIVDAWVQADVGGKRDILESTIRKLGDAAGISQTAQGSKDIEDMVQAFRGSTERHYAPEGVNDLINGTPAGIRFGDMATEWQIPSYRAMARDAKRNIVNQTLYNVANWHPFEKFMDYWKPAVLLRLGFVPRFAMDELGAQVLRNGSGAGQFLVSNAANAAKAHLVNLYQRLTNDLPEGVQANLKNITAKDLDEYGPELFAQNLAERTDQALKDTPVYRGRQSYLDTSRKLYKNGVAQTSFADEVSALDGRNPILADPDSLKKLTKDGHKAAPLYMAPGGGFRNYEDTHTLQNQMWTWQMGRSATDPLDREILAHRALPDNELVNHVTDFLEHPNNKWLVEMAQRAKRTADGSVVGVDATRREALQDWARVAVDNVKANFQTPDGRWHDAFADHVLENYHAPLMADVAKVALEDRPNHVIGPELVPVSHNWYQSIVDKGFNWIGKGLDSVSRKPVYVHNYATAEDAVRPVIESMFEPGSHGAEELISRVAAKRALEATTPYIHNPELRSQFDQLSKNIFPFLFAQVQFAKRWMNTFKHSPEALRKAQLGLSGIEHTGFVQKDDQGNDYFHYPAVGFAQKVLSETLSPFIGSSVLPITPGLSGHVKTMMPGLDRTLMPSVGPLVSLPLTALARRFPELHPVEHAVLGDTGTDRPYWEQVVPPSVARLTHVFIDKPDTSAQMGSAMFQAMQDLEFTNHGLPANASPEQQDAYYNRVVNWSRVLMLTRALFGFAVPSAPQMSFDAGRDLNKELRQLVNDNGWEKGRQMFLQKYGDKASAFTVFQSEGPDGVPILLPAANSTLDLMDKHRDFFEAYKAGSSWLLPQTKENFSLEAYREQLAMGLREKKAPREFMTDIAFAKGAAEYFRQKDNYDATVAKAQPGEKATLEARWTKWADNYKQMHPLFAQTLADANGPAKRQEALDQLRMALNDPRAPQGPQTDQIRTMVTSYDRYKARMAELNQASNHSGIQQQRKLVKGSFEAWAHTYTEQNPNVQGMFDRLIRPTLEG